MALNKSLSKKKLVQLQNYLFGTHERKLQVSIEFLDRMLCNYVYKRMRLVNMDIERTCNTSSPDVFFGSLNNAISLLGELEVMQEFFSFKYPYPDVYKKSLIENKSARVNDLIKRSWKRVHGNSNLIDKHYSPEEKKQLYLQQFKKYVTELSPENVKVLNQITETDDNDFLDDEQTDVDSAVATEDTNTEQNENQESDNKSDKIIEEKA